MDFEEFLSGARWDIVEFLGTGEKSPSEIAQKLKTSVPNISQHLKIMELSGIVTRRKMNTRSIGSARVKYALNMPRYFFVSCDGNRAHKCHVESGETVYGMVFSLMSIKRKGVFEVMLKFFMDNYKELSEADGIAISEITSSQIDVLIITDKHLDAFRGKLANQDIKVGNSAYKIALWSHTQKEFTEGLERKEKYFDEYRTKKMHILHDNKRFIMNLLEDTHG